ncbi:hypothetical protein DFS34DRAFT_630982 [Phlyctochytrium arcticum]|nr:hypothetical protein DFS34DRAFT_630982 [Phlyctochytrium arcticum]
MTKAISRYRQEVTRILETMTNSKHYSPNLKEELKKFLSRSATEMDRIQQQLYGVIDENAALRSQNDDLMECDVQHQSRNLWLEDQMVELEAQNEKGEAERASLATQLSSATRSQNVTSAAAAPTPKNSPYLDDIVRKPTIFTGKETQANGDRRAMYVKWRREGENGLSILAETQQLTTAEFWLIMVKWGLDGRAARFVETLRKTSQLGGDAFRKAYPLQTLADLLRDEFFRTSDGATAREAWDALLMRNDENLETYEERFDAAFDLIPPLHCPAPIDVIKHWYNSPHTGLSIAVLDAGGLSCHSLEGAKTVTRDVQTKYTQKQRRKELDRFEKMKTGHSVTGSRSGSSSSQYGSGGKPERAQAATTYSGPPRVTPGGTPNHKDPKHNNNSCYKCKGVGHMSWTCPGRWHCAVCNATVNHQTDGHNLQMRINAQQAARQQQYSMPMLSVALGMALTQIVQIAV